jgi:hypothetical protein
MVGLLAAVPVTVAEHVGDIDSPLHGTPVGTYNDPFTIRSSTVFEGVQRGHADLLRAQGEAAKLNAEAAVTYGEAQQDALYTRRAAIETYYELRQRTRELRAMERGPRPDPETLARFAREGRPDRLGPGDLDPLTGRLNWPALLLAELFVDARTEIDLLFDERSFTQSLRPEEYLKARKLAAKMQTELRSRIRAMPPSEYIQAKRFLESVVYEAAQPVQPPTFAAYR